MAQPYNVRGFSGLQTAVNQNVATPGALLEATNVSLYRPGIAESRPGLSPTIYNNIFSISPVSLPGQVDYLWGKLGAYYYGSNGGGDNVLAINDIPASYGRLRAVTGIPTSFSTPYSPPNSSATIQNRIVFPSNNGCTTVAPEENGDSYLAGREMGIPRAIGPMVDGVTNSFFSFAPSAVAEPFGALGDIANYRFVMMIKTASGQKIRGAPSLYPFRAVATAGNVAASFSIIVPRMLGEAAAAGYSVYVETYRTDIVATGATPEPAYYLAATTEVPSTIVADQFHVAVTDTCIDALLGERLYTDDAQQGEQQENGLPPGAVFVTQYNDFLAYSNTYSRASAVVEMNVRINASTAISIGGVVYTGSTNTTQNYGSRIMQEVPGTSNLQKMCAVIADMLVNTDADYMVYQAGEIVPGNNTGGLMEIIHRQPNEAFPSSPSGFRKVEEEFPVEHLPGQFAIAKAGLADAVPPGNAFTVGDPYKAINAVIWLQDSVLFFKEDGIFRARWSFINGSGNDVVIDILDRTYSLTDGTKSFALLEGNGYGVVDQGLCRFTETGIELIDLPIFTDVVEAEDVMQVVVNTSRREVYFVTDAEDPASLFAYSLGTQAWTFWEREGDAWVMLNEGVSTVPVITSLADMGLLPPLIGQFGVTDTPYADFASIGAVGGTTGSNILNVDSAISLGVTFYPGQTVIGEDGASGVVESVASFALTLRDIQNFSAFTPGSELYFYHPTPMTLKMVEMGVEDAAALKNFTEVVWNARESTITSVNFTFEASNQPLGDAALTATGTFVAQRAPVYRVDIPLDAREGNKLAVGFQTLGDGRDYVALEGVDLLVTQQGVRGQQ